ncbi:MAG: SurA N-terminal domain-containing protein [Deltaproteobacteria bacterium]|jgi:peptidyl-prolyl cis-trans isomerase D|nr:SurA N-terminal domain-containing protein [Deltaproteobacteria bacterium]
MLDFVRNKQKSIIIKLAFAVIILSFVIGYAMLGAPDGSDPETSEGLAARVNQRNISYNDFQIAYSNLYQLYQNIYQEQFTPGLERQLKLADKAINGLIDQALLQDEADRMGLKVSKQELIDAIAQVQAFQENGQFNRDRYLQVLSYQRLTTEEFEQMQRADLLINKVRQSLEKDISVIETDIQEEYRKQNDKVNLAFVRLAPEGFEKNVDVTPEALEAYFKENQETFRVPDMVALRYLQFVPERYLQDVVITEEQQERYYRRNLDKFDIPEQVKASHILIKADQNIDDKTREEKRLFAEKLLADIKGGQDFGELARAFSDDKASAAKGGDLDYFTRNTMVPAFEQAAFNMQPGELSDIIETQFGFHIIKVEGYIEPGIKKLDDVRDEVEKGLREELASQVAFEKAMDAYNINRKTGDLEAAADANELGLKETGLFTRDGYIDGIGRNEEIINAAFLLSEKELARPVVTEDGVFLFGLKERVPSHIPELAEIEDLIAAAYKRVEAVKLARVTAEDILSKLKEGENLKALASQAGIDLEETGEFTRSYSPFVPRIGTSEDLAEAAFTLDADKTVIDAVFEIQNRFVVATVNSRNPADLKELDEVKRKELGDTILVRKKNEAVQRHLDKLRLESTIEIDPRILALLDEENN